MNSYHVSCNGRGWQVKAGSGRAAVGKALKAEEAQRRIDQAGAYPKCGSLENRIRRMSTTGERYAIYVTYKGPAPAEEAGDLAPHH